MISGVVKLSIVIWTLPFSFILLGDSWPYNLDELTKIKRFAKDPKFQREVMQVFAEMQYFIHAMSVQMIDRLSINEMVKLNIKD